MHFSKKGIQDFIDLFQIKTLYCPSKLQTSKPLKNLKVCLKNVFGTVNNQNMVASNMHREYRMLMNLLEIWHSYS